MKRSVIYIRFLLQILLFVTGSVLFSYCKEDPYLDEPTSEGLNTHSFKVNGNEWVRYYLRLQSSPLRVSENKLDTYFISKIQGRDVHRPSARLIFGILSLKEGPSVYELDDFESVDSTNCFFRLYYYKDEKTSSEEALYDDVLSGEFKITRQDTIVSGTFDVVITNGTDTLTITEGKFEYNINYTF